MKTIAIIYLIIYTFGIVSEPFIFGEERKPYSAKSWLINSVGYIPVMYILVRVLID